VIELSRGFPFVSIRSKFGYENTETANYDSEAFRYCSYVCVPVLVGYTIYNGLYKDHKSTYSFLLGSCVSAIYVIGFMKMTPQLYINYKLKSVDHLPAKTFFYKFLNTIIDDLFSFIITMPTMHRLSCFRDDVIFVIYLYQRWIYRVDETRGVHGEEKEKTE
jgi:hypothetical protein